MNRLKVELRLFMLLFWVLAIAMHFNAWLSYPIEHIKALPSSSLGLWHPIFITLIVYIILALIRLFYQFITQLIRR